MPQARLKAGEGARFSHDQGAVWVAPGLHVSPFCSEPGTVSSSQDTCLQSACEGGPLPRPSVSPALAWQGLPTLGPLWAQLTRQLGSSGYTWINPQLSRLILLL